MIFDHSGITLEISNRTITRKSPNIWKEKNTSKQSMGQRSLKGNNSLNKVKSKTVYQQYYL